MSERPYFVHESACVDEPASIGAGTRIWHFSHVMAGAEIGPDCSLGQNVVVLGGVKIGRGVKIQNNVSVYECVELEDYVFCGPACVFTNVVNPRSEIVRKHEYRPTRVRRGASIGANATIVCGTTIGRYAFIAAGAVVRRGEVPDYALMGGVPAKQLGWMSRHGFPLGDPDEHGVRVCPGSGWRYEEVSQGTLRCLDHDEDAPLPTREATPDAPRRTSVGDLALTELPCHTASDGELVVIEEGSAIPFPVLRMFTVRASEGAVRGRHAHKRCAQFLVCVHGAIEVACDDGERTARFALEAGSRGLLVPPGVWATETYVQADSVLCVLCDRRYEADDYLRDYDAFLAWRKTDG